MGDRLDIDQDWICTSCGAPGVAGTAFCPSCGTRRQTVISFPTAHQSNASSSTAQIQKRSSLLVVVGIIVFVVVLLLSGLVIGKSRKSGNTGEASAPTTSTAPSTTVETTTTTLIPITTTTTPPTPTELGNDFVYEPAKCGIDASAKPYPHSTTQTYEATATVGLWSGTSTSSELLKTIAVKTYGPGGIGCPDGLGPKLTIICQVKNGQMIGGPFGNDPIWLRTTFDGATGYVPDQWVDTQWDTRTLPRC